MVHVLDPVHVIRRDISTSALRDGDQPVPGHRDATRQIQDATIYARLVPAFAHLIPNKSCHVASFLPSGIQLCLTLGVQLSVASRSFGSTHLRRLFLLDVADPDQREKTV